MCFHICHSYILQLEIVIIFSYMYVVVHRICYNLKHYQLFLFVFSWLNFVSNCSVEKIRKRDNNKCLGSHPNLTCDHQLNHFLIYSNKSQSSKKKKNFSFSQFMEVQRKVLSHTHIHMHNIESSSYCVDMTTNFNRVTNMFQFRQLY